MPKPEKQKSSGVACLIDGINTKRVQTLGINTDISREQIEELANSGVVEWIEDTPSVTIQIDTNDVGSTDTLALVTDKLLTYTDTSANEPRQGVGDMKFFIRTASSNASYRTITEQDMLSGYCSIMATLNEDGTAAARTMYMNRCAVTGVNLSYDVTGNAAENYTLSTDNKTWFLNDWANVRVYKPLFYQITPGSGVASDNGIEFKYLDSAIPDNSTVVAVGINNTILKPRRGGVTVGNASFGSAPGDTAGGIQSGAFVATTYALSTPFVSTGSASNDRVWIVYKAPNAQLWEASALATDPGWELESTGGAIGALRRGNIKAYLYNTDQPGRDTAIKAGKALRLQTVSIDVALGEEQLFELGTDGFYGISKQSPVPITVTVSTLDSDLEYFAMLAATSHADTNITQVAIGDFNGKNAIQIEVYKDKAQTTLLKTISLTACYVNAENFNVAVGDNATQEMTFSTDNISITGSGTNVTGGWYGAG